MIRSVFLARVLLLSAVTLSTAGTALASDERGRPDADPRWQALHEASYSAIAATRLAAPLRVDDPRDRLPFLDRVELPRPSVIVVGFTGGLEPYDSAISGVVRLRHAVSAHLGDVPEVAMLTCNNFDWRQAGRDVIQLVRRHHHRISHDVRLQGYLLGIVTLHLQLLAGRGEPA